MPKRESVSIEKLVKILNERLAEYEACGGVTFIEPYRLKDSAETEPNWSPGGLRGSGRIPKTCLEAAQTVVSEVATEYDLVEPTE